MATTSHLLFARRTAVASATLLTTFTTLTVLPARAQEAQASPGPQLEEIVVTGSRLLRSDLSAPSPVAIVNDQQIKGSGDATIESILYESPQLAAGNTSSVNANGGTGVLSANLRALGPTRTLVLVNGRRFVGANGDGTVDLATIPDALVKRVEIITGGASAVYGSDAIAGAVNFILKDDFEGAELAYMRGVTGESDGETDKIDLTIGGNFAEGRGNAVVYGSYTSREPVMFSARKFSAISLFEGDDALIPGGSGNIPGMRIGLSGSQLAGLNGVDLSAADGCDSLLGIRFGEGGAVLPFCQPQDAYNFAPDNYLVRPLKREQIHGLAKFKISDAVEMYSELHFVNTRNSYQQAPESGGLETPGAGGALVIPNYATNPILSAPVRQLFIDNPQIWDIDGDGTARVFGTGRRGIETGPRHYEYERDALNLTGGFRGEFGGDSRWRWDTFYQYQRSRTDELIEGVYSLTRVGLGVDVVVDPVTNVVSCRNPVLGCVPVNPFGLGAITPEAGSFIATQRTSREIFERKVAGASVAGEPFNLPAGPVGLAVGVEYREDQYSFTPGATDLAGEYGRISRGALAGSYDVSEYFAEVRVPILAELPFSEELAVEAAVRRADYSNFGKSTTWKGGVEWAPVRDLRVRAAYNRALRAPTLSELFSPVSRAFASGDDPCDIRQSPTQAQRDLCVQQGVPAEDIDGFTQVTVGLSADSGGNPALREEESETWTYGFVFTPSFVPGLNLALDYFDIKVDGAIQTISAEQALKSCFRLLDNDSAACRTIVRDPTGQIEFVRASLNNIGSLEVNGLDLQADYGFGTDALALPGSSAQLTFGAAASWLFERTDRIIGEEPRDCAGFLGGGCTGQTAYGIPDFKASLSATWSSGVATARLQARYIGEMQLIAGATSVVQKADAVTYFDFSGTVDVLDGRVEVFGGVDNLLDEQPPVLGFSLGGDANTDVSLYDVLGRRYFMGVRTRF